MIKQIVAIILAAAFAFPCFGNRVAKRTGGGGGGSPQYYYYAGGASNAGSLGTTFNVADVGAIYYAAVTFPSAGTVSSIELYVETVNATANLKWGITNAAGTQVGSTATTTVNSGSGDGVWKAVAVSIAIPSAGTYYLAICMDGPFDGALVARQQTGQAAGTGFVNVVDSYSTFPGSFANYSGSTTPAALRAFFTP